MKKVNFRIIQGSSPAAAVTWSGDQSWAAEPWFEEQKWAFHAEHFPYFRIIPLIKEVYFHKSRQLFTDMQALMKGRYIRRSEYYMEAEQMYQVAFVFSHKGDWELFGFYEYFLARCE